MEWAEVVGLRPGGGAGVGEGGVEDGAGGVGLGDELEAFEDVAVGEVALREHLEALAQIRSEAANPKTDLWWGGTGDPFLQAAELGLLEAYRPAYLDDLHGWSVRQYAMSGNMVGGFYTSAIGFGWNEEILKKKKLPAPRCWADLIDPKYKGEIETSHPASSGTAYTILAGLVQQMGEDAVFDYLKKLHRNVTQYTRSGQAQPKNVAKGEVAIGVTFIFGFENERQQGSTQVKWASPCEGTSYEIGGIALVKGARNKDAAKRYYGGLRSPAGQGAGAPVGRLRAAGSDRCGPACARGVDHRCGNSRAIGITPGQPLDGRGKRPRAGCRVAPDKHHQPDRRPAP